MLLSGPQYVISLRTALEMSSTTDILLMVLQIADSAAVAFKQEGIHLDTSIILPVFQNYFPYDLLFNWVGNAVIVSYRLMLAIILFHFCAGKGL